MWSMKLKREEIHVHCHNYHAQNYELKLLSSVRNM